MDSGYPKEERLWEGGVGLGLSGGVPYVPVLELVVIPKNVLPANHYDCAWDVHAPLQELSCF